MALRVWLPLSNSSNATTNLGLDDVIVKTNNATFANDWLTSGSIILEIPNIKNLFTSGNSWTICLFIKLKNKSGDNWEWALGDFGNGATRGFWHANNQSSTAILWAYSGAGPYIPYSSAYDGKKHHVAIKYDGSEKKLYYYQDGEYLSSILVTQPTTIDSDNLRINPSGTSCEIRDFKIYDHSLSDVEILLDSCGVSCDIEYMVDNDNVFTSFPKYDLADLSGFNRTITYTGSTSRSGEYAGNRTNSADYFFQSVGSAADTPPVTTGVGGSFDNFSVFWSGVIVDGTEWYATLMSDNPTNTNFWIAINCEGAGLWCYIAGAYYKVSNMTIANNTYLNIVFTYNSGVGKFYVNGEPMTTVKSGTSTATTAYIQKLTIGNSYNGSTWATKIKINSQKFLFCDICLNDRQAKFLGTHSHMITDNGSITANCINAQGGTYYFHERNNQAGGYSGSGNYIFKGCVSLNGIYECLNLEDGSCWFPLFYQNIKPVSGSTQVKMPSGLDLRTVNNLFNGNHMSGDINYYSNFYLLNQSEFISCLENNFELLLIQTVSDTNDIELCRWKQTANPISATFAQTTHANITPITNINSNMGGCYYGPISGNYIIFNDGTNGDWFGCGWMSTTQSPWDKVIPGYNGRQVSGRMTLYIRVKDNHSTRKVFKPYLHKTIGMFTKQCIDRF